MTVSANLGPPGQHPVSGEPLPAEGNLLPDQKIPGRHRCVRHNRRLADGGAVLTCEDGCSIHRPSP